MHMVIYIQSYSILKLITITIYVIGAFAIRGCDLSGSACSKLLSVQPNFATSYGTSHIINRVASLFRHAILCIA